MSGGVEEQIREDKPDEEPLNIMETKMSLSDKRKSWTINKSLSTPAGLVPTGKVVTYHYPEEDVKKFIQKLLKEAKFHPNPTCCNGLTWTELIKKEAGPKLIPTLFGREVKTDDNLKRNEVEFRG